jgi:HEAT repeat protein
MEQAERPLVSELRSVDPSVTSVWDLVNQPHDIRPLVDMLIGWLSRIDNPDAKEGIARALTDVAVRPAAAKPLVDAFRAVPSEHSAKWAIGNALSVVADDSVFDDIVELLQDPANGIGRQMLTMVLARSRRPESADILASLLDDEQVGPHALLALSKTSPPISAREAIERSVNDKRPWVRTAAKRALARIDHGSVAR